MVEENVNGRAGLQASYISSLLPCVFEVLAVNGGKWKKREAVKRDRRLRREKHGPVLKADFQTACGLQ